MSYTTRAKVEARVPKSLVVRACDRDDDGAEDSGVFDTLLATIETEIDGLIAAAIDLPFTTVPSAVQDAALVLVCEALYANVNTPVKENPWADRATRVREFLAQVGQGKAVLDQSVFPATTEPDESDWSMDHLDLL